MLHTFEAKAWYRSLRLEPHAIVNTSSILGVVAMAGVPLYTASKYAVQGLTKAAALQYAKTGIRINAVGPGAIASRLIELRQHIIPNLPIVREIHRGRAFPKPHFNGFAMFTIATKLAMPFSA